MNSIREISAIRAGDATAAEDRLVSRNLFGQSLRTARPGLLLCHPFYCAIVCVLAAGFLWAAPSALAQDADARPRVLGPVDDAHRVVLTGNTHPSARAEFDRGPAPDGLAVDRILLLLGRSAEQESALESFLAEQQDPHTAGYHVWLSPAEFGERFGPAESDVEQVTRWLGSHGFAVNQVSAARTVIEFSGTAGQVRQAFHTAIHKFAVDNEEHWANASDPQIPAALAPVVAGVVSLNDFRLKPLHKTFGTVVKHKDSARVTPQFTIDYNGRELYGIAPYDFATLYNVLPLWNAGITGAGQTIGIVGQSEIKAADVAAFRKAFDLPVNAPQIIVNGANPGTTAGDEEESDLDVEWAGAVAKNATIKFVTSASTATTSGVLLSAQYIVDKKAANILSMSYGACEAALGTAENKFMNSLWQQAAGEGISVFVASGDSGAAGCDAHGQTPPSAAQYGLAVNGTSSTPYNVAVGGTDLNDYNPVGGTNTFSTYWSTTNNASTHASLKKYVPEVAWNDSCTLANEAACNNPSNVNFVVTDGGGGGKSACTTSSNTIQSCSGGYAKPTWQKGAGVPADGKRDVPDLSLFAGDGLRGSFYLICDSDAAAEGTCDYANSSNIVTLAVGGTSAAAPAMAGIQALVNQKAKAAQGNVNPALYALAAKETLSGCNSSKGSGSACIFNDITSGTNSMPCNAGTPNCSVKTSGDQYGILSGYNAGTGFDLTTGLGSVNAYNLVEKWPGTVTVPKVTLSATGVAFGKQAKGTASAVHAITLTNSGTGALTGVSIALAGANPAAFVETHTCGTTVAAGGKCTINLQFKPPSTATYAASVSIKDNASGSPQTIALTGTGVVAAPAVTLSAASVAFGSQAKGTLGAAKTVTLTNSGTGTLSGIAIALGGTAPADFVEANNCTATLAVGKACTITVKFKPAAVAAYKAAVTIKDNAAGSPQSIALSGTGVTPAPAVTLSASSVAFGSLAKGTLSAAKTVTVTNSGTATLSGVAVSLGGTAPADFVEANNCTATLAAGKACVITVKFKPAAAAAYSAVVSIKDNATGSPQKIALSGTGFTAAPKVTLSATSLAFGNQTKATVSAAKTVTLTNSGTAALASLAITLAGSAPADFAESNNCGKALAAGAKCTISVQFKPASTASYTAAVSIRDNAAGSPQSIALSGTGITSPLTGTIIDYAGDGIAGYGGNNGKANKANLYYPEGTAEDVSGNLYIADSGNNVVRKVNAATGVITTYAGNGYGAGMNPGGYSGDGGPATKAELGGPFGVAVDKAGNLFIADTYNSVIRKVAASTGIITTVAGNGNSDYTGDGGLATKASLFWPKSVAVDAAGNLYISDTGNKVIRKVTASTGKISTIAGGGSGCGSESDSYGDGCPATEASLEAPGFGTGTGGIAVDAKGNVYIADPDVETVRKVNASNGIITVVAGTSGYYGYTGNGGAATKAVLNFPTDVKVDGAGNIFISDAHNNVIREVSATTGKITTVAGIYYASGGGKEFEPETAATGVKFDTPAYISIDFSGNLFITDVNDAMVDKVYGIASPLPVP